MLKGRDILGMPVICLASGQKIGQVCEIVFDPLQGKILGFILDGGGWFRKAKVIRYSAVVSLGEDAITVGDEAAVITTNHKLEPWLRAGNEVSLIGAKVISERGNNLGIVEDLLIDVTNGKIYGYEISGGLIQDIIAGRLVMPKPASLTVGEGTIIVSNDAEARICEQIAARRQEIAADDNGEETKQVVKDTAKAGDQRSLEDTARGEPIITWQDAEFAKEFSDFDHREEVFADDAAEVRLARLIGRPIGRSVRDQQGRILIAKGEIITPEIIQRAEETGKIAELLLVASLDEAEKEVKQLRRKLHNLQQDDAGLQKEDS